MPPNKDDHHDSIVIIRRRGEEDDHHHGGVWKIAYADFMTAMMAFFLVMWLINASNTETRANVASYFNPMRLMDSVQRRKGLLDVDEKSNAEGPKSEKKAKEDNKKRGEKKAVSTEPSQAASETRPAKSREAAPTTQSGSGKHAWTFRDPFNPLAERTAPGPAESANKPQSAPDADGEPKPGKATSAPRTEASGSPPPKDSDAAASPADPAGVSPAQRAAEAEQLLSGARSAVRELGLSGGPGVDVKVEGDAIVLNLADTAGFGMFAVGWSEPNASLVALLKKITPLLASHGQRISIRGHTDGRPFRGEITANNWHLSMARAEAAYVALVQAGVDDTRFERIEGRADRDLKVGSDPQAAANRRIEIVMRQGKP